MVVDDHPFIRSALKLLLGREGFDILEAANGADAVRLANEHKDTLALIVLDIYMSGVDGFEVIERILKSRARVKIIILTSLPAEFHSMRCFKAGASGFVSKSDDMDVLLKAIEMALSGYTFFPEFATNLARRQGSTSDERDLIDLLSNQEMMIFMELARGFSNKQIADVMALSNKTISTYKARVLEKLGVKSLVGLHEFAKRNNVI